MSKPLPTIGIPLEEMEKCLKEYLDSIDMNTYPDNVDQVQPHHIRVIASLGDSLTFGSRSENFIEKFDTQYPGNSFFSGADDNIEKHLTIFNIFRYISQKNGTRLIGGSTGVGYGPNANLNMAIGGRRSDNMPAQASDLVRKIQENKEIDFNNDWKLVSLWIGTNDIRQFGREKNSLISPELFKLNLELAINILKQQLPRTIVSIIGMFPAQLLEEADHIMSTGKRPGSKEEQENIDFNTRGYLQSIFEIQNEQKYNKKDFSVVVQPFATEYFSPVKIKDTPQYFLNFYARDRFHLSKLGQAVVAKNVWNNMFEKVGEKTKNADLSDTEATIFKLNKENAFIRTVGNSKS